MGLQSAVPSGLVPTYTTFGNLPLDARDGAVAVTLDTNIIYVFDRPTLTWVTQAAGQENFSYKRIPLAQTVTIPVNQQMIVINDITIEGTLVENGELFILEVV
jgi:hypothetical protein